MSVARRAIRFRGNGSWGWAIPWLCALVLQIVGCRRQAEESTPKLPDAQTAPLTPQEAHSVVQQFLSAMQIGKGYYENRSAKDATASFQKAVDLIPTNVEARLNLVRALLLAAQNERALDQAKEAERLDRASPDARYLTGLAYARLGRHREAIAYFEPLVRVQPEFAAIHYQLGVALLKDGETNRAMESFTSVTALDPRHVSARYQLAMAAQRSGDEESARRHLAEFEMLSKAREGQPTTTEELEQCKFTQAFVSSELNQPAEEPGRIRFATRILELSVSVVGPWTLCSAIDAEGDGDWDVLARDGDGRLRLLRNDTGVFSMVERPLAVLPKDGRLECRTADFNNDGRADVFVACREGGRLLRSEADGSWTDNTEDSGQGLSDAEGGAWADYDHDGDLDLWVIAAGGTVVVWQNRGNGTFGDATLSAKIPTGLRGVAELAPVDWDGDEDLDMVVAESAGSSKWLRNDGLGAFAPVVATPGWPGAGQVVVEDFDNDLDADLLLLGDGVPILVSGAGPRPALGLPALKHAVRLDYDNDGWVDLMVSGLGEPGDSRTALRLYRNQGASGWREGSDQCLPPDRWIHSDSRPLVADFDGDGDTDLLMVDEGGAPRLLANEGGNANRQLQVRLKGTRSNRSGIGSVLEVRARAFQLSRRADGGPLEIGVGSRTRLETLRVLWPNGIVKNEVLADVRRSWTIDEPHVSAGSCPYLYAWDGREFQFITDILGSSPLGLSLSRGNYVAADTDEYLELGDDMSFVPRDGRYVVRITDELRELLYLDVARLIAVNHPSGTEVYSSDKLQPPPFPRSELRLFADRFPMRLAVDSLGINRTLELSERDGRRTAPVRLRPPQLRGLAEPHALDLNFGSVVSSRPLALVLTGWLQWGDAGVNLAGSQNSELPNPWPVLESWRDRNWHPVDVQVGLPAGKTKTIVVDLPSSVSQFPLRLRLTSGFEVYWDRIALFEVADRSLLQEMVVEPLKSDLFRRGFPMQVRADSNSPIVPDPLRITMSPPWATTLEGWCTRYGDILELLLKSDDRYVIFNGGDASDIEFGPVLAPPPSDFSRSYFLYVDGWDKDGDYNVQFGDTVEPLPFHGMDDQLYGQSSGPEANRDWAKSWNTRWVPANIEAPRRD